jgi:hypothetical protein
MKSRIKLAVERQAAKLVKPEARAHTAPCKHCPSSPPA